MGGSSSGRRQQRERQARVGFRPRPPVPLASGFSLDNDHLLVSLTFEQHAITSGFGFDLLSRMGHVPGTPLGPVPSGKALDRTDDFEQPSLMIESGDKQLTSIQTTSSVSKTHTTEPIPIVVRRTRAGLGSAGTTPRLLPTDLDRSSSNASVGSTNICDVVLSPATLAESMEVLSLTRDPLRPRCRYNDDHIVADLKAKQRHERRCPDRPHDITADDPGSSRRFSAPASIQCEHIAGINFVTARNSFPHEFYAAGEQNSTFSNLHMDGSDTAMVDNVDSEQDDLISEMSQDEND